MRTRWTLVLVLLFTVAQVELATAGQPGPAGQLESARQSESTGQPVSIGQPESVVQTHCAGQPAIRPEITADPYPVTTSSDPYPVATSPDLLIANFERAYNERNLEEYARTLNEAFVYVFPPEHAYMASPDGIYDRDQELASADRIFHGKPGWNWMGGRHRIVTGLQLRLHPLDAWRQTAPDEYTRVYGLRMIVDYEDGEPVFVNRRQEFTVVAQRFEYDVEQATYTMLRWREAGCSTNARLAVKMTRGRF